MRRVGRQTVIMTVFVVFINASRGDLDILLSGYDNIPSDGSGQVEIPHIGTFADGAALVCRHNITGIPPSSGIDNWYYINEAGQQESVDTAGTGWSVSRGQNDGVVRLERLPGVQPLEGNYSCVVERTNPTRLDTVTLYLYWPITRVEVVIEVISQHSQQYNVTCMSEGGSVQSSSFTGPAGEDLGHLQPVEEEPDMRGADNYSISVIRTGGTHGDTFQCMASNGDSTGTANSVLSVAGSAVNVSSVQVTAYTPTLHISWSSPQDGASVTGYVVYYENMEHTGTVMAYLNTSILVHDLIADGRSYEITVEAQSIHLSGYSTAVDVQPCLVPNLTLSTKTSNSLSLSWERPDYYTGSITVLIQYRAVPDGSTVWLYVEDSDDIPTLTGLNEFTEYSIQMALIDSSKKLCVFSESLIVTTAADMKPDCSTPGQTDVCPTNITQPTTAPPTSAEVEEAEEGKSEVSTSLLVGVAAGGMVAGMLVMIIVVLGGYILHKDCIRKRNAKRLRRAQTSTLMANEHYIPTDLRLSTNHSQHLQHSGDEADTALNSDSTQNHLSKNFETSIASQYEEPVLVRIATSKLNKPASSTTDEKKVVPHANDNNADRRSRIAGEVHNPMYADPMARQVDHTVVNQYAEVGESS